ncbi:MAG: TIGR02266 family protein [Persicimonas sp.]
MTDHGSSEPEGLSRHRLDGDAGQDASYAPSIVLLGEEAEEENRRRAARKAYDVAVYMRTEDVEVFGLCGDISEGGLFVTTHEELDQGTHVQLEVLLPDSSDEIILEAEVRWRREGTDEDGKVVPPGLGVKFLELDDEGREHIKQIVAAVEAASDRDTTG